MPKMTEADIRAEIVRVTKGYRHVLDCGPASVEINAPRALMQLTAIATLDALYSVLGEDRPRFTCDDRSKRDH